MQRHFYPEKYQNMCEYDTHAHKWNDTCDFHSTIWCQPVTYYGNDQNNYHPSCDHRIFAYNNNQTRYDLIPTCYNTYGVQDQNRMCQECELRDSEASTYHHMLENSIQFATQAKKGGHFLLSSFQNEWNKIKNATLNAKFPQKNVLNAVKCYVHDIQLRKQLLIDGNLTTLNNWNFQQMYLGDFLQQKMDHALDEIMQMLNIYELCIQSAGHTLQVQYGRNSLMNLITNFDKKLLAQADTLKTDMHKILKTATALKDFLKIENLLYRSNYDEKVSHDHLHGITITDQGTIRNMQLKKDFGKNVKNGATLMISALETNSIELNKRTVVDEYIKFLGEQKDMADLQEQKNMASEIKRVKQKVLAKYPNMRDLFEDEGNTLQHQIEPSRPPPQNPDAFLTPPLTSAQMQHLSDSLEPQRGHDHFAHMYHPSAPTLQPNPLSDWLEPQKGHSLWGHMHHPSPPTLQPNQQSHPWYQTTNNPELYGLKQPSAPPR